MVDAWHRFGGDLMVGPTGDIACALGSDLVQQRLLRRLLTNPGDYIWDVEYGAGLGQFIGTPVDIERIAAVVRRQMYMESSVARSPEPVIDVTTDLSGAVAVQVRYAEAVGGDSRILTFTISM